MEILFSRFSLWLWLSGKELFKPIPNSNYQFLLFFYTLELNLSANFNLILESFRAYINYL